MNLVVPNLDIWRRVVVLQYDDEKVALCAVIRDGNDRETQHT